MKITLLNSVGETNSANRAPLVDALGRRISYLRLSVTDRCDLRCTYCMHERQSFLPKADLLDYREMAQLVDAFIARGVTKLRITGGEPLVRQDVIHFLRDLSTRIAPGQLGELTLTTNGTQLAKHASDLAQMGICRINVSLDSLDREKYAHLTRRDVFPAVIAGIHAALKAGLKIKINTVALRDQNLDEIPAIIEWAHGLGMDLSLIEIMPLGEGIAGRVGSYASLADVRSSLEERWSLDPLDDTTGGPSRYVRVRETAGRLGFITPLSHNFCDSCNRVRVTCTGVLFTCLGHENGIDLKSAVRSGEAGALDQALDKAMLLKPAAHAFDASSIGTAATQRTMSVTGG